MNTISAMGILLASGSPRRREILSSLGYEFDVVIPDLDERNIPGERPEDHVRRLSLAKAQFVAHRHSNDLVIGADTIVVLGDAILGKPSSPEEAVSMLSMLSGKAHTVFTGLSLVNLDQRIAASDYDSTEVIFNDLRPEDIRRYVESGEPSDKAGAYGIQGMGSFLVHRYYGELDTIIGFPTKLFKKMLQEVTSCHNP
jgi:septum formation protein